MKLKVEYLPLDSLRPYVRNARTHSESQISQIAASIGRWGFTNPVLIDDADEIIAGHGRILGAAQAGITEVPCIRLTGLSADEKRALVLADNQIALNAGWDEDLLKDELLALAGLGFEMGLLGFSDTELVAFMHDKGGQTDPDDVPEPPEIPETQPGDIWLLGDHRIICGDSTDPEVVDALLAGEKPHLMVTDPPYGIEYDAAWRNRAAAEGHIGQKKATRATGVVLNDDNADWATAYALFPGDVAYVWHAGLKAHIVSAGLEAVGFELRAQIIWAKNNIVIGRGHFHPKHEPCWYAVRGGRSGHWQGSRKMATVWNIDKPMRSETGHSTQKPVECMQIPIECNSQPGDLVYEPFSGSGTTIIAGQITGRKVRAIELNPAYVDIAVRRWEQFTGGKAVNLATGREYGSEGTDAPALVESL